MINKLFPRYSDNNLVQGETIHLETSRHWINFINKYLFLAIGIGIIFPNLLLISIGVIFFNFINLVIIMSTDECVVTNKRVIFKTGIIMSETLEMNLTKIESLSIKTNLLGTILGYGTIIIRGTGGTQETFLKVNKPYEIRTKIQELSF